MTEQAILLFSLVLATGFLCQWLSWRLKTPVLLFLLLSGIIEGPVLGLLNPELQLGPLLFPFVSLSVAIILFEGSLTLKFADILGLERVIRNLITYGALLTWILIALSTHYLIHFSWSIAFLFAALMVVTGPTVISPLLRTLRPNANIANVLQWEGILIDPIGAILAVLVFEFIISGSADESIVHEVYIFIKMITISAVLGLCGGMFLGLALRKYWIPQYLQNFAVLTLVCGIFSISNYFEPESGMLSVTLMGVCLANLKNLELDDILNFKENLSILLVSFLFIILAARINFSSYLSLGWPALVLFILIQFVIRPINVYISALGSKLTLSERHLIAWIAPRGIVAAAISALFAIKLEHLGYAGISQLVPLTFFIIMATVLLQSFTAKFMARFLKVAEPEPQGFLVIGANKVAQALAQQLTENGFYICLADENWSAITAAKMKGLPTFWGNPVSKYAETNLDLQLIKHLLIMTPYLELNILAAKHYRLEFDAKDIYTIQTEVNQHETIENKSNFKHSGRDIFYQNSTFEFLESLINSGAQIKTTLITEQFTFDHYLGEDQKKHYPLFAIDLHNSIHVFTVDFNFSPVAGWKVLGIEGDSLT